MNAQSLTTAARALGTAAFHNGESGVPALNAAYMHLIAGAQVGQSIEPAKAFVRAYTIACLNAPIA